MNEILNRKLNHTCNCGKTHNYTINDIADSHIIKCECGINIILGNNETKKELNDLNNSFNNLNNTIKNLKNNK